jgi:hypothetical protein
MNKNNRAFKRPTPRFRHQGPPEDPPVDIQYIWAKLTLEQKGRDISLLIGFLLGLIITIVRISS